MTNAYLFDGRHFDPLDWPINRGLRWAAWRPDGSTALLVGNRGTAIQFDGSHLETLATLTQQNLRGAAWSPDGETALIVGNRGLVLSMSGESVVELRAVTSENLRRVCWHPSGDYALIVGNSGTILRHDRAEATLSPLPGDRSHTLRSIAFRPDGDYALVGAYASRWVGYPKPHALYRCDGRFLQALLGSDDEDDFVAADWSADNLALVCGYARLANGALANKALLYDGSDWRSKSWKATGVILGGAWRPRGDTALLVGENGLAVNLSKQGGVSELDSEIKENLIGPFWKPDGSFAIVLKGPGAKIYTV